MVIGLAAYHGENCALTIENLARDMLGDKPWVTVFVADAPDGLVGYAALNPLVRLATGQRGMELQHLFVEHPMRGRGVGTRLLETAINFAKSQQCSYFALSTRDTNEHAQAFYLARGFQHFQQSNLRFILQL